MFSLIVNELACRLRCLGHIDNLYFWNWTGIIVAFLFRVVIFKSCSHLPNANVDVED